LPRLDALVVSDYDKGLITDALADRVLDECVLSPQICAFFVRHGVADVPRF